MTFFPLDVMPLNSTTFRGDVAAKISGFQVRKELQSMSKFASSSHGKMIKAATWDR